MITEHMEFDSKNPNAIEVKVSRPGYWIISRHGEMLYIYDPDPGRIYRQGIRNLAEGGIG